MSPITITEEKLLSDNWYILKKFTYQYVSRNGDVKTTSREAYDRGNGATILLYNEQNDTVILTRQFRLPTYINGNSSGLLIEACAGLLDEEHPEVAITRETREETGLQIKKVERVYEAYMSPGSVTERLFFFIAHYSDDTGRTGGGGVEDEEIEVLEIPFAEAMAMVANGEIRDGKTIMLLQHLQIRKLISSR